jgi:exonuclease SbcC
MMRSLELELENFTSFRSRQTLDFSNLDLFAVTGPTGAGKTSLLDAITFALYGHVARFGKDAKASELVSQGKDNLKVSFQFSVRGVKYKITRTWRKRTKTEDKKVLLEQWKNGAWEKLEKLEISERSVTKKIEEILGMDFDTFTRVILLPQGKFDEFIKGNKAKRREILRELAGFEIFEKMRQQAYKQADILKNKCQMFELQLAELQLPSVIEVAEQQQELEIIEQRLPIFNEAVSNAQKALDEAEELFKNINRLTHLNDELNKYNAKELEIKKLKFRLQQAQAADRIKGQYDLLKAAQDSDRKAQTACLSAQKRLTQAKQELDQNEAELRQYSSGGMRLEQLKQVSSLLRSWKILQELTLKSQQKLGKITCDRQQAEQNYQGKRI